jgi:hypothetical protein
MFYISKEVGLCSQRKKLGCLITFALALEIKHYKKVTFLKSQIINDDEPVFTA